VCRAIGRLALLCHVAQGDAIDEGLEHERAAPISRVHLLEQMRGQHAGRGHWQLRRMRAHVPACLHK
jgi:hypothetical protein